MSLRSWFETIEHRGTNYQVEFVARDFREGYEVLTEVGGQLIRIAELGLGKSAALSKLTTQIDKLLESKEK